MKNALQGPLYHQNWRPLPPVQRTAILPAKALYTAKISVLCFLSRNPPPKGQLFCPSRPSIPPKLASFVSFPEPPPKGQLFCPPRPSAPSKLASLTSSFPKTTSTRPPASKAAAGARSGSLLLSKSSRPEPKHCYQQLVEYVSSYIIDVFLFAIVFILLLHLSQTLTRHAQHTQHTSPPLTKTLNATRRRF